MKSLSFSSLVVVAVLATLMQPSRGFSLKDARLSDCPQETNNVCSRFCTDTGSDFEASCQAFGLPPIVPRSFFCDCSIPDQIPATGLNPSSDELQTVPRTSCMSYRLDHCADFCNSAVRWCFEFSSSIVGSAYGCVCA